MLLVVRSRNCLLLGYYWASIGCTPCLRLSGSCISSCGVGDFVGMVDSGLDDLLFLGVEAASERFVDALLFLLETCLLLASNGKL